MSSRHLLLCLGAFLLLAIASLFAPTARAATPVPILAFAAAPPSVPATTVITVTNPDDSGNGSLRQAIASANPAGGDTIVFSLTLPSKITLTSGELVITKTLTISGTNPLSLTVSGGNSSRVFNISNGANVTITYLTMRDGKVTVGSGGVISHSNVGALTLTNSRVISGSSSSNGGGIYHSLGVLNINATTIYSNTSANGGGIYIASGNVTIANGSIISRNIASTSGAGLYLAAGALNLTNSSLITNAATTNGGGIYNAGNATLSGSTLSNNSAGSEGGGIENSSGTLTVTSSTIITGNTSSSGSGIFNRSTMTVTNGVVSNNTATTDGGGFYNLEGTAYLSSTIVSNNLGQNGGGIANEAAMTVTNSTIISNISTGSAGGGGVYNTINGVLQIMNSTFMSNTTTTGSGAGLHNSSSGASTAIISGSTFNGNGANGPASEGGGISNSGTMTLTNSTISGNTSTYDGGGLSILGVTYLNNSTITNNTADPLNISEGDGGGIFRGGGTLNFKNTIIAGNIDGGGQRPDCAGSGTSQGYNLIGSIDGCSFSTTTGDQVGGGGNPVINPRLAPLHSYGGATKTHMLLFASPAIDAGNPSFPGSGGDACLATDQRGVARPAGSACDIGAYEGTPFGLLLPLVLR